MLIAALALFAAAFAFSTEKAYAKSYECPQVDIQAEMKSDATLHVVEERTFDFEGSFTAIWWELGEQLPSNASVEIYSIVVFDASGERVGVLAPDIEFQPRWRSTGGPSVPAWSFDEEENTVYAFGDFSDEALTFRLEYDVANAAQIYDDAAELYWAFVGSGWAVDSEHVILELTLPQPEGASAEPGVDVRAWGHGPLDGNVKIEGNVITYTARSVPAGQYAEARVLFPVNWLSTATPEAQQSHAGQSIVDTVLAEEQAWADRANRERAVQMAFVIGLLLVCIAAIVIAIVLYFRFGKEHKPDFDGDYWRDVPQKGVPPAVIGRLWRWDKESPKDLTATIITLCANGAVGLDVFQSGITGRTDYRLTRRIPVGASAGDELSDATMEFLFQTVSGGADTLMLNDIQQFGKDHPQEYMNALSKWQGTLSTLTNQQDYFEMAGHVCKGIMMAVAAVIAMFGIALTGLTENFVPVILVLPTAAIVMVIANQMERRSQHGADVMARAKALRHWLEDFSALNERPPADVKVWGVFMVYAFLFGVADKVIKELRNTVPEVFAAPEGAADVWVPWYIWYWGGPHISSGGIGDGAATFLDTALSNTANTARAAISGASGGFSSGGGFGGGFSMGGGGGFGGGGGAR